MVVSCGMVALLHNAYVSGWYSCCVMPWNPLHPPFIRVIPGQYHSRLVDGDPRIGKGGWDRGTWRGLISDRKAGWERSGLLNQALIKLNPPGVIERHGSDQLPRFSIGGHKAGLGQRALR